MFTCASCSSPFTEGPVCSVCKQHYDFQCSGVTEAGYRKLGERKNAWKCSKCKCSPCATPGTVSPQPNQLDKIQSQLSAIALQLAPLPTLFEDVKTIKSEVSGLSDSLEMAHELIGKFSESVKIVEQRVEKVEQVIKDIPNLHAEVSKLKQELDERDQWARANNVEIRGIPFKKNENLYDYVKNIGKFINVVTNNDDINYIARIPTRIPNTEKPIIVAFNNRYKKEEFVTLSRKGKNLNLGNIGLPGNQAIYVNDHLTQRNKNLLNKAKNLAKENNFKYIWVRHSKIMARKSDTSPVFFIKSENDLLKIS
ncbi:hypothetical protein K1T71_006696 [Dendrolimus kikuchii]|uniref:Uncharacterized protein n=2 Tax=Dendrolimus kikuchii TaxID=765133 RepID=A0ACC1CQE3_9NEOP|nr:hypothetical protein K1T71_010973 [Dendrolimus kikuchii]KAJ0177823.1 hypothetical protein K1T71_006696 [Dendrolimus kikuchii]